MSRMLRARQIEQMDPQRDHQRIVHLLQCYEFPWDMTRSLELALFRTFCVPRTSKLLDSTGEFRARAQKRYDDTDIIISEMIEWGYESARGQAALARMNELHGRFNIRNEDFVYVLSTFIYEPIRWMQRYGWRPMVRNEQLALFYFWTEVGRRMGIQDIPTSYEIFEQFNLECEATRFEYNDANHRTAMATLNMFANWFPRPLRSAVRAGMCAVMDDRMRQACGLAKPSRFMRWLVPTALRMRARILRYLPVRRKPHMRTEGRHRTYPHGYTIQQLGPPP